MFLSHFSVLSSLVFPFLVREKAIETNNPRNNERASRVERERERERKRFIKRRRETERDLAVLSRRKKKSDASSRFHLFFLNVFVVIPVREACRFGKQKSIDPIVSLLPKKKKKKKKEGKRICEKTKERRIKTLLTMLMRVCVCCFYYFARA